MRAIVREDSLLQGLQSPSAVSNGYQIVANFCGPNGAYLKEYQVLLAAFTLQIHESDYEREFRKLFSELTAQQVRTRFVDQCTMFKIAEKSMEDLEAFWSKPQENLEALTRILEEGWKSLRRN